MKPELHEILADDEAAHARIENMRIAEAMIFASSEPLSEEEIAARLPPSAQVASLMEDLQRFYVGRGVNLVKIAGRWNFRTAEDLRFLLARETHEPRRISRAALETLAIIAYHQPVTRAEIEDIRGVSTSKGTLDLLIEIGWVRLRGRRKVPGIPVTYGTTPVFLSHFNLNAIDDLPGLEELKGAGFFEGRIPPGLAIPAPSDTDDLLDDEEPLGDLFEDDPLN
jgi:segregation and condensation protein B